MIKETDRKYRERGYNMKQRFPSGFEPGTFGLCNMDCNHLGSGALHDLKSPHISALFSQNTVNTV